MTYATGRLYHDADAHIMETADWLRDYADPKFRDSLPDITTGVLAPGEDKRVLEDLALQADASFRAEDEAELMNRKNWRAVGATLKQDRPRALDLLGFASQLVFNTFTNKPMQQAEHGSDGDYAYAMADAHNRGMFDFCSVDRRLLTTAYLPIMDLERAPGMASRLIREGAHSLMIAAACPKDHSPSHVALDAVWAQAEEAGVPIVFHVGSGGHFFNGTDFASGLPVEKAFHGGAENFRSIDYMAIPNPVMQTLSTMILDGVMDRFPKLQFGVIEQGASWLPSWMRYLASAYDAFLRHEQRLQNLALRASEYVRRRGRVPPYPTEDVGWVASQAGEGVCLFSSDYPHVEGGRNPLGRFENSLADATETTRDRFFAGNFAALMGPSPQRALN